MPEEDNKNIKEFQQEKRISEGLAGLKEAGKTKAENPVVKETLESKMPPREEKKQETGVHEKIKIPVAKMSRIFPHRAEIDIHEKPAFVENTLGSHSAHPEKANKPANQSIMFKDKEEVSRRELKQEMRKDPKIWQAEKQLGLNLSRPERAGLVKEVFAPRLGKDISKADLEWSIKKLNRKLISEKNPVEHAKIRKEIKFFKKIGGIK